MKDLEFINACVQNSWSYKACNAKRTRIMQWLLGPSCHVVSSSGSYLPIQDLELLRGAALRLEVLDIREAKKKMQNKKDDDDEDDDDDDDDDNDDKNDDEDNNDDEVDGNGQTRLVGVDLRTGVSIERRLHKKEMLAMTRCRRWKEQNVRTRDDCTRALQEIFYRSRARWFKNLYTQLV